MIIEKVEVWDLMNKEGSYIAHVLAPDLNILTGRNGSGKTTLLKLIWYCMSGNIEYAIKEVPFLRLRVTTSLYTFTVLKKGSSVEFSVIDDDGEEHDFEDAVDSDGDVISNAIDDANEFTSSRGGSVFFPTFRRIEGGFSISDDTQRQFFSRNTKPAGIQEALNDLSRRMSNSDHTFVASLSTHDIVDLLVKRYTEISDRSNILQQQTSQSIINSIKSYKIRREYEPAAANERQDEASIVIDKIQSMIEELDQARADILAPYNAVQDLVQKILQHTGINLGRRLRFGEAANAISSDALSAGEKQMLSFLCYNAFNQDAVIFVDEPELSLHVDWQRQLFPILQSQGTSNQFIIATHSPFIYGKYPDKELLLSDNRGETSEHATPTNFK